MKKTLKLKKPIAIVLKIILIIGFIFLGLFIYYKYQISQLMNNDYSETASKFILKSGKKKYVLSIGRNETLNAAFESADYKEENLDSYSKIEFHDYEHLIESINLLIDKGYSNNNISLILNHGSDLDVLNFAKRDKIKYLEEFYSISYAKLKYYDDYVKYSTDTGEDEETTVLFVNLGMNCDDYTDPVVISKFSYDMLVNKHHVLSEDYVVDDLVEIDENYTNGDVHFGDRVAVTALKEMFNAASNEGYSLVVNSSYRSYDDQSELCDVYRNLYGDNYVKNYMAMPGYSEHQTGLAFDIGSRRSSIFANSLEYTWIIDNAYKYGFILRFPKKYENITGFRNEPWHFRYVGKKIAKYIYENDITFEEYYAIFLDK